MRMNWKVLSMLVILSPELALLAGCDSNDSAVAPTPTTSGIVVAMTPANIVLGGKLYDDWIKTAGVATPSGNSPLWASQGTNTRTGKDTWRCKECHGWDYKGRDGAYGSGSHYTGFPGVQAAGAARTAAELVAFFKGTPNANHNFSAYLNDANISALAAFLKTAALVDDMQYIDYATKTPKSGNATRGRQLFEGTCVTCHGDDGRTQNFGSAAEPEYVGTVAFDNPWEFLHKVRFGQPATTMPAALENGWSLPDVVDVLTHARTLPVD